MKKTHIESYRFISRITTIMILLSFVLAGCTIRLIADYDEATDIAVTELQRKIETFFVELESNIGLDAATYENNIDFYKGIKVDVSAIELRAAALPKNKITQEQIVLLKKNVASLEEIHKEGIASIEVVEVIRKDFNTALANILRLELTKKRGQKE